MHSQVHVFGDSHADFSFRGYEGLVSHITISVTCFRVGRDGKGILNFQTAGVKDNDTIIVLFGEVDCRCHIKRQLLAGREYKEVLDELVTAYGRSISLNVDEFSKLRVIVSCIPPPTARADFENIYGPITHEFPFVGSDAERAMFTRDMNDLLKVHCRTKNYDFLDFYDDYTRVEDGMLDHTKSDTQVHIKDNAMVHQRLRTLLAL